tara:strand:- start:11677 stop:12018 length:342 start_codon:yes stop_codon:yes gene_type:complete
VTLISDSLLLPAASLAMLAWLVPKLLSMVMPEGVKPLLLITFLSTVILFAISAGFFVVLYVWQGITWAQLADFGMVANVVFYGKLGLIAGLIWAPIMVLSVANLPRGWVKAIW